MDTSKRPWFIYALRDPRDSSVRYVGVTSTSSNTRFRAHLTEARSGKHSYKCYWIKSLLAIGLKPQWEILETGLGFGRDEAEKRWISHFRTSGCLLTNLSDGGEGSPGYIPTTEEIAKRSAALKGRKFSEEHRRNLSIAHIGITHSRESRAKMSASNKGKKIPQELMEKLWLARKAKLPEIKERMSAHMKDRVLSEETRAKISAANKRRSPEDWVRISAAISAANIGRSLSVEHKMRIAAGMKRYRQDLKSGRLEA